MSKKNPPTVFEVGVTYEVVTPESAEHGEAEDRGWELEPEPMTLREALAEIDKHGPYDTIQDTHNGVIFYGADPDRNYRDGSETLRDVVVKASARNLNRLYAAFYQHSRFGPRKSGRGARK